MCPPHTSVLYIDSHDGMAEMVTERIRSGLDRTATVEHAARVETAVETVDRGDVECVVTGLGPRHRSAADRLAALREADESVPVVVFSYEPAGSVAEAIADYGIAAFLEKGGRNWHLDALVAAVERALRGEARFAHEIAPEYDAAAVLGRDGYFEEVTEEYAALYGYEAGTVRHRHWTTLHPTAEVEYVKECVLPIVDSGADWTGLSRGLRADRSTFTERKHVTRADDGRLRIAVSERTDVVDPALETESGRQQRS